MDKKYGLKYKKTGKAVGFFTRSNENGYACCETQFVLDEDSKEIWLVDDPRLAEWVRFNSTKWYNAQYESPTHYFQPEDLEVVEVVVELKPVEVSIPTPYEFFRRKYQIKNPLHWEHIKEDLERHPEMSYDWYDLMLLEEEDK